GLARSPAPTRPAMPDPEAAPLSKAVFPTTRWSRVAVAGDPAASGARAALEELCRAYWYPLYALIRRKGHGPDEAADLTQAHFVRAWALRLLDGALEHLAREYADSGRAAQFEALQVVLSAGPRSVPYAALAARLGTTEGAVQAAVQRLRRRYRGVLREQVAAT